jgi:predicted nucleotidyltransferase
MEYLRNTLVSRDEITFAYVHGSFLRGGSFRDVDIAIYCNPIPASLLDYELDLEVELSIAKMLPCSADVRILNGAPLSFKYSVLKDGTELFSKDLNVLADFKSITVRDYLDFSFHTKNYMREAFRGAVQ